MKYSAQREPDGRVRVVAYDDDGQVVRVDVHASADARELYGALVELFVLDECGTKSAPPPPRSRRRVVKRAPPTRRAVQTDETRPAKRVAARRRPRTKPVVVAPRPATRVAALAAAILARRPTTPAVRGADEEE